MVFNIQRIGFAALLLVVAGCVAPSRVLAQDDTTPGTKNLDVTNKTIDLDLESTNLYYGLKLLFSQVKANFTIDESLKSLTVTAHLTQVPFRVALETLLKSTSTPLSYKVENGIYSVVPKVEEPEITQVESPKETPVTRQGEYTFGIIRPTMISAIDLVLAFGGHVVNVGYAPSNFGQGGLGGNGLGQGGIGGGFGGGSGLGGGFGSGTGGSSYGGYGGGSNFGGNFGGGNLDGGFRGGSSSGGSGAGGTGRQL